MDTQTTPSPTLAELLDYPVHPFAKYFPMLAEDELVELAADIKANGLNQPLVVRREPRELVDGRNRLAACHKIGHEPAVEFFDGDDEDIGAFILGQNNNRRHSSKGQRAMAAAMISPPPQPGKKTSSKIEGVKDTMLSYARTVRRLAPELVMPVINGSIPLKDAYDKAKDREQAAQSVDARLEKLRGLRPDLAALVVEGTIGVEAAFAEIEDQARKERIIREEGKRAADQLTGIRTQVVSIKMAVQLGASGLLRQGDVAAVVEAANELQAMLAADKGGSNEA